MSDNIFDILLTPGKINFSPENSYAEILQNVITICTTIKGTRPLNRDFGVSQILIDQPAPAAAAKFNAEIFAAVKKYEPRAEILNISWKFFNEKITPEIKIKIKNA